MNDETADSPSDASALPWIEELRRPLTPREAQQYLEEAGLQQVDAAIWAGSYIGPFEAGRAVRDGRSLADVIQARRDRANAARLNWPGFSEMQARDWVESGFDSAAAQRWHTTGMQPTEARAWRRAGFESIDTVSSWRALGFDCDVAEQWRDRGFQPAEAAAWGRALDVWPEDAGSPQVPAEVLASIALSPAEAFAWKASGFVPTDARRWSITGLSPDESATRRLAGATPDDPDVNPFGDAATIAWGVANGELCLGTVSDFERLAEIYEDSMKAFRCTSWREMSEQLGANWVDEEFGHKLDDLWADSFEGEDPPTERPTGWYPDEEPDLGDWLTDIPRISCPDYLDLPTEFFDLAEFETSMMSGDYVSWPADALPEIARIARQLRCALVLRQDLVSRATQ